jgi:hypothetical protein
MEEFNIDIVHCPGRWHDNVDGLTRAYERVGDVSKDDDFLDAAIMSINAKEAPEEYREIIQYLDGMRFFQMEPQRQYEQELRTRVKIIQ